MDEEIQKVVEQAIKDRVFPGGVVGYIKNDTRKVIPFGYLTYENKDRVTEETVYDLASVTKVIPTNSIILSLIEQGLLSEEDQVIKYVPELKAPKREEILVKHLLTFTVQFDIKQRLSSFATGGAKAILDVIYKAPLSYKPGERYHYSNTTTLLLGIIAEKILQKPLDEIADELLFRPLRMESTTFHPERLDQSLIAPTEINERGEVRGKVHDETAWAFYQEGLVPGNAGVFSSAGDLLNFGQMILDNGTFEGLQIFKQETIKKMGTEIFNDGSYGMSLGWDMNKTYYMSQKISPKTFGKDGFTGTAFFIEPDKKICLVVLSNRTYPKRPETTEKVNKVRIQLEETVLNRM